MADTQDEALVAAFQAKHLTDWALGTKLRLITSEPRRWRKAERDAFIREAAFRLEGGKR